MLDTRLPQLLGGAMVAEFEPDSRLELLELSGTQLHVEVVPLVADLQDLGPREPVDAEPGGREQTIRYSFFIDMTRRI